jgi:hypothetical protein
MKPEISAALLGLVLGMAATADVHAAAGDATCRKVNNGAVSRVCRWHVGQGNTVDVYYGEPSNRAPAQPVPIQPPPPPAYYAPAAYYDDGYGYGYGWGYPYLPFIADTRVRGRQLGPDPRLGGLPRAPGPRMGFRGGFQGGFHGGFQGVGFRGGEGGWRH